MKEATGVTGMELKDSGIDPSQWPHKELKITFGQPVGIRWLLKKDGTKVLQAAYSWTTGMTGGTDWIDVPMVEEE